MEVAARGGRGPVRELRAVAPILKCDSFAAIGEGRSPPLRFRPCTVADADRWRRRRSGRTAAGIAPPFHDSRMLEPARLEERDEVVAAAAAALADAGRGSGRLVVIEGPAGIGKSSLLDVIAARAGEARVLRARAHEIESRFVLGVTRQLFEPLLAA